MDLEFRQIIWDDQLEDDCRALVRLAVREDLDRFHDLTTAALIPAGRRGSANVTMRSAGILCGIRTAEVVLDEMEISAEWSPLVADGQAVDADTTVARLTGPARDLLTAERILLNLLGRLSGIATLTREYVQQVQGTQARIYDTRKTTPGWRRLEKYAVRCGGGTNHRTGLFDAVLIKDNHLAFMADTDQCGHSPADAVRIARRQLDELFSADQRNQVIVEVEVDTLEQLDQVLPERPDIVLLDNMTCEQLRIAVTKRDGVQPATQLEASGGVTLNTIGAIAKSGVDRISVGALTHSATSLDVGLDWERS